jgi:hypothetical protein
MVCDTIRNAIAQFGVCAETPDGARIVTHCLYPSFEPVYVYVGKAADTFYVHDGRGAYDSGWEHGRDEADVASAIRDEALRYHLRVSDDHRLTMEPVTSEWLPSAILAVANASAAAANAVVSRPISETEEELVAKIEKVLATTVDLSRLERRFKLRGHSGGVRRFDFAIMDKGEPAILINGVSSHAASYSAKYVTFADVDLPFDRKIAIREGELRPDVESLVSQVATIVPLAAVQASKIGEYRNARLQ